MAIHARSSRPALHRDAQVPGTIYRRGAGFHWPRIVAERLRGVAAQTAASSSTGWRSRFTAAGVRPVNRRRRRFHERYRPCVAGSKRGALARLPSRSCLSTLCGRRACRRRSVCPSSLSLDQIAESVIRDPAYPSFLGYHGYPASILKSRVFLWHPSRSKVLAPIWYPSTLRCGGRLAMRRSRR